MSATAFTIGQLVLVMGLASSAVAQYTPGNDGKPTRGGGRMGARGDASSMPTASRIDGPATPAVLRDTIGVTGQPMDRYAVIYANHMATTGPMRDSLRSGMKEMREAFETGGRDAARKTGSDLRSRWKDLSKRDQQFEKVLEDLLSKDQQKRYKKWKEAREQAEKELLAERRRARQANGGR